jgi:hypothetical protein
VFWLRTSQLSWHTVVSKTTSDRVVPLTQALALSSEVSKSFRNLRVIIIGAVGRWLDDDVTCPRTGPQNLLQPTYLTQCSRTPSV